MTTTHAGRPASRAELQELHRLLVTSLSQRMKEQPSAELMAAARSLLRDNGIGGRAIKSGDIQKLQRLWRVYLMKLTQALLADRPPAAVLSEARMLLTQAGLGEGLYTGAQAAKAVFDLAALELPFGAAH